MKITKITIFEQLVLILKTGVCDKYGLNFFTWMNYLTSPLMSEACEIKACIIKRAILRDKHKLYKTCKFNSQLYKCYLLINWQKVGISFCYEGFAHAL